MRRRTFLGILASGTGLAAGCTGGVKSDEPSPTDDPTPTPVVDGTPAASPEPPETPTDPPGSPEDPTETPIDPYAEFPEGPKEPPEKPDSLTLESVKEYVKTFEYRFVYNSLWYGESSEVHNECEIQRAAELESGFEVVVSCTAWSNTGGAPRETGTGTTTVIHADYFTQTYRYVVTEDSVSRVRASMGG